MTHRFDFQIAYADTDAGGIVYHARYVEIAERARMAAMSGVSDSAGGFVVRDLHLKYLRPLRLSDKFHVETRFAKDGAATMAVDQKFIKDDQVFCELTGTAVYVSLSDMKPRRLPAVWQDMAE